MSCIGSVSGGLRGRILRSEGGCSCVGVVGIWLWCVGDRHDMREGEGGTGMDISVGETPHIL